MAKLTPPHQQPAAPAEAALQARVAELEALLEARTQVIISLHRRIAELEGHEQSGLAERAQHAEDAVRAMEGTTLFRLATLSARLSTRLRNAAGG
ncbi:MAG: hypothetical protein Q7V57_19630 [Actinomycetota bacterium]|nr:hypothetical protein [Actinomycetota bacterium]